MTTRNSSSTSSEESQPMPDFDWENSPNNLFTLDKNKFIISKFLNNQLFKPSNMKRFKPKRMKRSSKRSKGESLATTSYDLESPNLHSPVRNNINIATQSIADDITENMEECTEEQVLCEEINNMYYDFSENITKNLSTELDVVTVIESSSEANSCEENIEIEYDDNMVGTEEVQILDTIEPIFYDHGCSSNQLPTPEITNETQTSGTISCEENIEIEYDDNMVGTEEVQILDTIEPIFHDHGYSFNQSPTHEITNETKTAGTISSDVIDLCESNESTESIDELENSFNSNNSTNFSSDNSGNKENAVVGQNKINLLSNIRVSPPHECTIKPSNNDVLLPNENYVAVYNELQAVKNEVNSLRTEVANLRQRMEEIKRINMEAFKSLYETIRERKWKKKRSKKHKRSRSKREKY